MSGLNIKNHYIRKVKPFLRTSLVALTLGFLTLGSSSGITAQSDGAMSPSIGISPGIITTSLKVGQTTEKYIEVTNYGKDPIPLSASVINIEGITEDGAPSFTTSPTPRSAAGWVEILEPNVIIATGEHKRVKVLITPAADTAPGGYHAAIIFQAKLPSYYFDLDTNARILPAVSTSLILSIESDTPPSVQDLQIGGLSAPKLVVSSPIPLVSDIKNPTNFFIYSDAKVQLQTLFGGTKDVTEFKNTIIFPTSSRKYIATYDKSLLPGIYTADIQLRQGDKVIVASTRFIAIPWQFIVLVLIAITLAAYFTLRRRFKRAWRILLGKEKAEKSTPVLR